MNANNRFRSFKLLVECIKFGLWTITYNRGPFPAAQLFAAVNLLSTQGMPGKSDDLRDCISIKSFLNSLNL